MGIKGPSTKGINQRRLPNCFLFAKGTKLSYNNWAENVEKEENLDFKTGCPIYYLMPTSDKVTSYKTVMRCSQKSADAVSLHTFLLGPGNLSSVLCVW